jgi:hypothetical protein
MSEKSESSQSPDPFEDMIRFYENASKVWSQAMAEAGSSEKFAEAMGKQMETQLQAFAQARSQFGGWMDGYLRAMNLPARGELTGLAERLTALEIKLDDLDAKLDEILDRLKT